MTDTAATPAMNLQFYLSQAREDLDIIAAALRQEAMDRGWCDEYHDFIDTVNARCSEPRLHRMHTEHALTLRVEVYVRTETHDENEAYDMVRQAILSQLDFEHEVEGNNWTDNDEILRVYVRNVNQIQGM